jgi:hypothetical protein
MGRPTLVLCPDICLVVCVVHLKHPVQQSWSAASPPCWLVVQGARMGLGTACSRQQVLPSVLGRAALLGW